MRLSELVEISNEVSSTRARSTKVALLTRAVAALDPEELAAGISHLSGEPRQPRLELGPTAVHHARPAPASHPTLTVGEVDAALQQIAEVTPGTGSRARRVRILEDLLARATEQEQRWLRALLLRELRQGALTGVLVPAIARAADVDERLVRRAHMLSGDLRETARAALEGGAEALGAIALQVGVGLQPMLATSSPDVRSALEGLDDAIVEAKLDGARVQVHRQGNDVRVFTRNLREVGDRLPEIAEAALRLPVASAVLDGEVLAFDADGRPLAFQDSMQRFGRDRDVDEARMDDALHLRVFDVLHLDGVDLLDHPLHERLTALAQVVPDELRIDQLVTSHPEQAEGFLQRTLAAGHEGVMVKDPTAPYEAGRRGAAWRKVKPVHTLDLVVLAAEWGSGRRRGWLSNLHLGARAEPERDVAPDDPAGFVMLGKTFKGLTDELLTWQTEQLLAREIARDGHVVRVRPELVVEIALDGVVRSPRYPGGLALRFARVRGYRPDKAAAEADTLADVRAIHAGTRIPGS